MTLKPAERPWQYNLFPILAVFAALIVLFSFVVGLFTLTPKALQYWGGNEKLTRDIAGVDLSNTSTGFAATDQLVARASNAVGGDRQELDHFAQFLLADFATIQSTVRWKTPLTFLGVATFMTAIALAFSSIPKLLDNRGDMMRVTYRYIVKESANSNS